MFDIKVDKKKTRASIISSFKKVFIIDQIMRELISIPWKNSTPKNNIVCAKTSKNIMKENPRIFPKINSYLLIGFERIKNIVFHSTSLNKSWLHTNKTHRSQKTSIIASQKSTIILLLSQIVSFPKVMENIMKMKPKNKIIYRYLFLIISLKVFRAMFNIRGVLSSK